MRVKEAVFKFIEKHPDMSLDQIVNGLPELNKASVRKYYYDFKKLNSKSSQGKKTAGDKTAAAPAVKAKSRKTSVSIRRKIYDLLDKNAEASIDDLCGAIEGCNRKTIRDYRNRWRKENALPKSKKSSSAVSAKKQEDGIGRQDVYSYMQNNPDANLNDLKNRFPNNKKLVTDFRSWKHQHSKKLKAARKSIEDSVSSHLSVDSYKKTIQSLKQVIEKQKSTIETQRSKLKQIRSQLSQSPKFNLDGLKSFLAKKIFNK